MFSVAPVSVAIMTVISSPDHSTKFAPPIAKFVEEVTGLNYVLYETIARHGNNFSNSGL